MDFPEDDIFVLNLNQNQAYPLPPEVSLNIHVPLELGSRTSVGPLSLPFGSIELTTTPREWYASIGMKIDGKPQALAYLIWHSFQADDVWQHLLNAHDEKLQHHQLSGNSAELRQPGQLPWLAISFSPRVVERLTSTHLDHVLALLTGFSRAILRSREQVVASN